MSNQQKTIATIIILVVLTIISQIDKNVFYIATALAHILFSWEIAKILPKGIMRSFTFVGLLSLVLFLINGINGLGTGILGTIVECKTAIPELYKVMAQELLMIPNAIKTKNIGEFTPHAIILGIAAALMLGKLFLVKTWETIIILNENMSKRKS